MIKKIARGAICGRFFYTSGKPSDFTLDLAKNPLEPAVSPLEAHPSERSVRLSGAAFEEAQGT